MKTATVRAHGRGRLQLNARLVREKDRARLRELRRLTLYGAAIVVPLLIYVWQRVDFIRTSYRLEALNRERQVLQEQNKQYTLERSSLLAPDRIEKVARRQLGLSEPAPADVRRVQVIDGQVNEIGPTLADGRPDAETPAPAAETRAPAADERVAAARSAARPAPRVAARRSAPSQSAAGRREARRRRPAPGQAPPPTAASIVPVLPPPAGDEPQP